MFKFSSSKVFEIRSLLSFLFLISIGQNSSAAEPLVYNAALIHEIIDDRTLSAVSDTKNWEIGEIVPVVSANAKIGVFAFAEVSSIKPFNSKYEVRLKLIRQSRKYMILKCDYIKRVDL